MQTIGYVEETRDQFDAKTRRVLDTLSQHFEIVEFKAPEGTDDDWFFQIWEENEDLPTGLYGTSSYAAALLLATALGIEVNNDTDPIC